MRSRHEAFEDLPLFQYTLSDFEQQEPEPEPLPKIAERPFQPGDRVANWRWPNRVGVVIRNKTAGLVECDFDWPSGLSTCVEEKLTLVDRCTSGAFAEWRWWPHMRRWTYTGHMSLSGDRVLYPNGKMFLVGIDPND